jgi:LacI family transcriptional regulator
MVTIRDIAKKSKVTPGTVSMVLNGRGRLSAETRSRVEAVIAEMGYKPKSVGRPRRTPQRVATTIAVVYAQRVARGGVLSQLSQAWIAGIRDVAIESHCHLSLIGGFQDGLQDQMFRQSLDAGDIDGVIFIGITSDDGQAYLNQTVAKGIPTVVMNRIPVHSEFSYVAMDNFGSGKQVMDFLIRRGHERIALVHLQSTDRYAVDRRAGAEAALASHDLSAVCTEVLSSNPTPEELQHVCSAMVKAQASAVYLTAGDDPAARCIDTLQAMGLHVPSDISVIGWDDIGVTSNSGRRPSSVGYDKHAMGREAAQMLIDLMKRSNEVRSRGMVVPTRVVEHDTTTEFLEKIAQS